jgi:hypothetical protein
MIRTFAAAAIFALLPSAAVANTSQCTDEEARTAEAKAASVNTWREMYEQFQRYAQCDDGAIAEGYSESVTRLLAQHWDQVQQLAPIVRDDPTFRMFIVRHIDETISPERLAQIVKNANRQCPENMEDFCSEIQKAAVQN